MQSKISEDKNRLVEVGRRRKGLEEFNVDQHKNDDEDNDEHQVLSQLQADSHIVGRLFELKCQKQSLRQRSLASACLRGRRCLRVGIVKLTADLLILVEEQIE